MQHATLGVSAALSRWKPHATFSLSGHGSVQKETYCNQCMRHFVSSDSLEDHFLESKFHFYCKLCVRHFRDGKSLENHHKTSRNHYHCPKCNISVTSEAQLTEHYLEKHAYCVLCRKLFDNDEKLRDHLAGSHHVCWDCNVFYTTEKELKDHYARLKKHPYCSTCKEGFSDEEAYTRHLTVSKNHYYCIQCKRDHNSAEHLLLHFDSHEHRSHKLIKCPFCPRTFEAHSSLVIHFEIGTCAGKNKKDDYKSLLSKHENLEKPMKIINDIDRPRYYLPYHGYPKHTVEYSRHAYEPKGSSECVEVSEPVFKYIDSRSMEYVDCEPSQEYERGRHSYHERSRSRPANQSRSRSRHSLYFRGRSQSRPRHHIEDSDDDEWEDILRQSRLATNRSWNGYKFECVVCCSQYHTLERLNAHLARDHEAEVYRCAGRNGCGRTFPSIRGLIRHVETDDKCGIGRWRSWRSASMDDLSKRFRLLEC
ncbi:Myoneurin [Dactylellina cionopaga]|nr:Myoneurin [Dactylellina cionopaga]